MNREKKKDMFTIKLVAVIGLLAIVTGTITFGFFSPTREQTGNNTLVSGCFNVTFTENTSSINLTNAYAISDEKGQATNPYSFTIQNTCDTEAAYHILLNSKDGSFDDSHINVSVDTSVPKSLSSYNENTVYPKDEGYASSHILKEGSLKNGESATFEIRAWINAQTAYEDVAGKNWQGQVKVVNDVKALNKTVVDKIIASSNGVKTNFDEPATTDEGVFEMEDDYGTSYYYRGAVENNYVKFAGFYWRIIRVNGDGSLRVFYAGKTPHENGQSGYDENTALEDYAIAKSLWNVNYNDSKYVGYMFGGAKGETSTSKEQAQSNDTPSTIKGVLDTWYETNIKNAGYSNYVSDTLFCNDRSTVSTPSSFGSQIGDTGLGYGTNVTSFGYWNRFDEVSNTQPTLKCANKNDAFTVSDIIKGNGNLTYPIGLITADEVSLAGNVPYLQNVYNYLYNPSSYWSFSPAKLDEYTAFISVVDEGILANNGVYANGSVIPVINLRYDYVATLKGTGTASDPYTSE